MNKHICKAKRLDNGEWLEGFVIELKMWASKQDNSIIYSKDAGFYVDDWGQIRCDEGAVEVDPNTICRYTGLEDKDGVPIFEYDIVETEHTKEVENLGFCSYFMGERRVNPLQAKHTKRGVIRYHNKYKLGLAVFWNKGHMDINNSMTLFNCNAKVIGNIND